MVTKDDASTVIADPKRAASGPLRIVRLLVDGMLTVFGPDHAPPGCRCEQDAALGSLIVLALMTGFVMPTEI